MGIWYMILLNNMDIKNKYFILSLPEPALNEILLHCIGKSEVQRKSVDGKNTVVKLPVGVIIPAILQNKQAYNHSEILIEMAKLEWTSQTLQE